MGFIRGVDANSNENADANTDDVDRTSTCVKNNITFVKSHYFRTNTPNNIRLKQILPMIFTNF